MQLELTEQERHMLRDLLHDYLPDLRREASRTEVRELRHELVQREELCERLLTRLDDSAP